MLQRTDKRQEEEELSASAFTVNVILFCKPLVAVIKRRSKAVVMI